MSTPRELLARYATQSQMSSFFIDKLKIASLDSYSANGDGVTDDTTAWNSAMADFLSAGGGILCVPAKPYYFSGGISVTSSNVTVIGAGYGSYLNTNTGITISGKDNVKFFNLRINQRNYVAGAGTFAFNILEGSDDCLIQDCNINSASEGIKINDSNGTTSSKRTKIINNYITCLEGIIVGRTSLDSATDINILVENNTLINTANSGNPVGVEIWCDKTRVINNNIYNTNLTGGSGAITLAVGYGNKAIGNYVEGFTIGCEFGNFDDECQITSNTFENCLNGIAITEVNEEQCVVIDNNHFIFSAAKAPDSCISLKGCASAKLQGNTFRHDTSLPYTNTGSRLYTAIVGDTKIKRVEIIGCKFVNLNKGIAISANDPYVQLVACEFNNVNIPVDQTGSNPIYYINNTILNNTRASFNNRIMRFRDCMFVNSTDFAAVDKPPVQSYASAVNTIVAFKDCKFTNVLNTSFAADIDYSYQGTGFDRPAIEYNNDICRIQDIAQDWSALTAVFSTAGESLPANTPIVTWPSGVYFENGYEGNLTRSTVAPSTGTWNLNARCFNTSPSAGGYSGWICTSSGSPGTWKGYGLIST